MSSRRSFLQQASSAELALSTSTLLGRLLSVQSPATVGQTTRIFMNSRRTIAPLDRNLFGSSLEHPGRAIYEGVYDPASKFSDSNGFRKDVIDKVRKLGVPVIRFLSSDDWHHADFGRENVSVPVPVTDAFC